MLSLVICDCHHHTVIVIVILIDSVMFKWHLSSHRVNQDSINDGRRGSKQQCLAAAKEAVLGGRLVMSECHDTCQAVLMHV